MNTPDRIRERHAAFRADEVAAYRAAYRAYWVREKEVNRRRDEALEKAARMATRAVEEATGVRPDFDPFLGLRPYHSLRVHWDCNNNKSGPCPFPPWHLEYGNELERGVLQELHDEEVKRVCTTGRWL